MALDGLTYGVIYTAAGPTPLRWWTVLVCVCIDARAFAVAIPQYHMNTQCPYIDH